MGADGRSVFAAMVRDALLGYAARHEGFEFHATPNHTFGPHPEKPSEVRRLEGWPHALAIGFAVIAFTPFAHAAGDRELGQYLSSECVTCHQLSGMTAQGIPPIAGQAETAFIAALNDYRAKKRPNPIMQTIAAKFSQEEIAALAAYFASLRPQ
jgi:cytochrome c